MLRFVGEDNVVHYGQARSVETDIVLGQKVPVLDGSIETGFKQTGAFETVKACAAHLCARSI